MAEYYQWVRQHNVLIFVLAGIAAGAVLLRYRRLSRKWWLLWSGWSAVACGLLFNLHTPAATLTSHAQLETRNRPSETETPQQTNDTSNILQFAEPTPQTIEDIHALLKGGDRPTLVEVYSDFGLS